MSALSTVDVEPLPPQRFEDVLAPERYQSFVGAIARAGELLAGRVVWNVNSTARGGGVAEMLQSLIAYARGANVDARWLVIEGDPDFFRITKRLHNNLHGSAGDGGALGDAQREAYEATMERNTPMVTELISAGDIVIVHDPQPAGLIGALKEIGAAVVWRCHIGLDTPTDLARNAWRFLMPYVSQADATVFSRAQYAWEGLSNYTIIPPSIDAFAPKNQDMDPATVTAILDVTGLMEGDRSGSATFTRWDGNAAEVTARARYHDGGDPPPPGSDLIVQVSRWDRLKDPIGVLQGFARHIAPASDAHLVLAGPEVEAVSDDPEGAEVLEECAQAVAALDDDVRTRVHLACLPMEDGQENAAIVNALQRRADIVVQKSLAEGFGLTVSEAMWKARPVVASRIGGIQDQVLHGITGLLIDDPHDLVAFGAAVNRLLDDGYAAAQMGEEAQMRVRDEFLGARHLMQYVELFETLI